MSQNCDKNFYKYTKVSPISQKQDTEKNIDRPLLSHQEVKNIYYKIFNIIVNQFKTYKNKLNSLKSKKE